jgi:4-amino-4-deoxy-L-arabinose transferase-like glycosyltransferase
MRLTALCWLLLLLCSVWYASWLLAGRTEMQPADPFGASASRIDFGRSMADCALLIMLATFGLLERSHETTAHSAQIAWVGVFLLGCARALERPKLGGAIAGVAIGLTVLTRGIPTAVVLTLTAALAPALSRPYRLVAWPMLSALTLAALATALPWPLALGHADWVGLADPVAALNHRAAWLARNTGQLAWPTAASWSNLLRNLPWFFWPAWPIAAWAVWQWRSQRLAAAVALPALCTAGLLMLAVFSTGASEVALLPAIAPMAMLAALGVPALRRGISSLIDWFAVMSFSLIGLALWAYWLAFMTGWPPRMALSAQRAVRGFMPILDPLEALLGLAATIAWIVLVYWRVSRQPRALPAMPQTTTAPRDVTAAKPSARSSADAKAAASHAGSDSTPPAPSHSWLAIHSTATTKSSYHVSLLWLTHALVVPLFICLCTSTVLLTVAGPMSSAWRSRSGSVGRLPPPSVSSTLGSVGRLPPPLLRLVNVGSGQAVLAQPNARYQLIVVLSSLGTTKLACQRCSVPGLNHSETTGIGLL